MIIMKYLNLGALAVSFTLTLYYLIIMMISGSYFSWLMILIPNLLWGMVSLMVYMEIGREMERNEESV